MPPVRGGAARRARGRLHRAVDEPVADRGVHPDPADGRHRRAPVPRVRGHAVGGDPDLAGGLADHDADDVRAAAAAAAASGKPGRLDAASERVLRRRARAATSARSAGRCATAAHDAAARCSRSALNVYLYIDRAQGLLPAAGHRPADRRHPGRPEHLVPGDARRSSPTSSTSCAPTRRCETWSPSPAAAQAQLAASMFVTLKPLAERTESADQVIARLRAQARHGARRDPLPAAGAGHPHRRPPGQRAVPVHAAGRRPRRAARVGADASAARCAELPELADVNTDQQDNGACRPSLVIDRDTASRLGVTPRA